VSSQRQYSWGEERETVQAWPEREGDQGWEQAVSQQSRVGQRLCRSQLREASVNVESHLLHGRDDVVC
jgi:hypothetical protein